jgi:SAM-dependent methyltransferase
MTVLPFANDSFDVVLSSIAIHNIKGRVGKDKAVEEAVRVLRPGGRLMIADIGATRQYCEHLKRLGMAGAARRGLGWRMWWGGPWMPTHLVNATKPGQPPIEGGFASGQVGLVPQPCLHGLRDRAFPGLPAADDAGLAHEAARLGGGEPAVG